MPCQPTKEFYANEYVVRVVDYEFSLANRTAELVLPAASVTYVKEDGSEGSNKSGPLTLTVTGPVIPSGQFDLPLLILGLTIVLPIVAAHAGIKFFHARAVSSGVSAKKKKTQ